MTPDGGLINGVGALSQGKHLNVWRTVTGEIQWQMTFPSSTLTVIEGRTLRVTSSQLAIRGKDGLRNCDKKFGISPLNHIIIHVIKVI